MSDVIYLDYAATTPMDPRVVQVMVDTLQENFGNSASRSHPYGWKAEEAVEQAREQVAKLIHADPKEIVFTSGATESNNLAIKGAAHFYQRKGKHIVTCQTEHKAVIDATRQLEREGFEVTYLKPLETGLIDLAEFQAALRPDTILVSIMHVNNEIGVIQPIEAMAKITREKGIVFHCDAAQSLGKIEIDMSQSCVDLMSFSGHKIYGPKGIGALYVRRQPRVRLEAQMHGGGHERGLRSGTLPTHQIVGFGEACRIATEEMAKDYARVAELRKQLLDGIQDIPEVYVNGDLAESYPGIVNVSFNYVEGESLLMALKELALSSGSACTSASLEPSYVLRAIGRSDELAHSSLRISMGRFTTAKEIETVIARIHQAIQRLRDLSPLWEMHQAGIDVENYVWTAVEA